MFHSPFFAPGLCPFAPKALASEAKAVFCSARWPNTSKTRGLRGEARSRFFALKGRKSHFWRARIGLEQAPLADL